MRPAPGLGSELRDDYRRISRQRFSLVFSFRKRGCLAEHRYRSALRLKSHDPATDRDPRGSLMLGRLPLPMCLKSGYLTPKMLMCFDKNCRICEVET